MVMQQAGIIDPRALQQARQNPRVQMAEGLASSGIAGALKELIDDRVTMEAMELVAAADRDEAAKMTDKPSIKDSNTQGINQLVQTLAPGMQLRNNQIQRAQMQKMLGLGGQPAPNMRMADGGIVGFEESGKMQPIPMLMQKYGSEKVMEFLNEQKRFRDIEGNVSPQAREQFEMMKANIESRFDPEMIRAIRQAQSGPDEMADGGVVALKEGGFPDLSGDGKVTQKDILMGRGVVDKAQGGIVGFDNGGSVIPQVGIFGPAIYDFTDFLVSKGIENISDLSSSAIESLTREFEEQKAAGDARAELADMGDAPGSRGTPQARPEIAEIVEREAISTGRPPVEQMGNLEQVLRGGVLGLLDTIKREPGSTLMADMGDAPGSRGTPQARADVEDADVEENEAAQGDIFGAGTAILGDLEYYDPARGPEILREGAAETRAIRVEEPEEGILGQLGRIFSPTSAQRAANRAMDSERERERKQLQEARDYYSRPLSELTYYDPNAPKQTDETEAAKDIIAEGETPPRIETVTETEAVTEETPTEEVNLRPSQKQGFTLAAFDSDVSTGTGTGTETGTGTGTGTGTESAVNALGALELSGEGSGAGLRDQVKRIIDREEDPVRIALDFGRAFGKGNTPFQGLQLGGEVLDAAENKLDTQITALERLIQAADITDAQMRIAQEELAVKREQIDAIRSGNLYDLLASINTTLERQRQFSAGFGLDVSEEVREQLSPFNNAPAYNQVVSEVQEAFRQRGIDPARNQDQYQSALNRALAVKAQQLDAELRGGF